MQHTLLHMWTSTKEAPSTVSTRTSCFDRASSTKSPIAHRCVLIHEVGIFCPPTFAEVLYLHNCWKQRDIHRRFRGLCEVVTLEDVLVLHQYHEATNARNPGEEVHLMESALVPIFLQERLLAFRLLLS